MNTGTVKFYIESKGYGFITDDESKKDIFVHISGLEDEVKEGDAVSFDVEEGRRGLNAVKVKKV